MTGHTTWIESKVAETSDAARNGDGCHPEEAQALSDYLDGTTASSQEAARRITAPILSESHPSEHTFRLWALLCEAIVELNVEYRHLTFNLLSQIQALPSSFGIEWNRLPGFAGMWNDLYGLHLHGAGPSPIDVALFDEIKHIYDKIGHAEAEMFLWGFPMFSERCGYRVLNLVYRDRLGIEFYLGQILGWLEVAGWKLKQNAMSNKTIRTMREYGSCGQDERMNVERTLAEHWEVWKEAMLGLCQDTTGERRLSEDGRRLVFRCYELM